MNLSHNFLFSLVSNSINRFIQKLEVLFIRTALQRSKKSALKKPSNEFDEMIKLCTRTSDRKRSILQFSILIWAFSSYTHTHTQILRHSSSPNLFVLVFGGQEKDENSNQQQPVVYVRKFFNDLCGMIIHSRIFSHVPTIFTSSFCSFQNICKNSQRANVNKLCPMHAYATSSTTICLHLSCQCMFRSAHLNVHICQINDSLGVIPIFVKLCADQTTKCKIHFGLCLYMLF